MCQKPAVYVSKRKFPENDSTDKNNCHSERSREESFPKRQNKSERYVFCYFNNIVDKARVSLSVKQRESIGRQQIVPVLYLKIMVRGFEFSRRGRVSRSGIIFILQGWVSPCCKKNYTYINGKIIFSPTGWQHFTVGAAICRPKTEKDDENIVLFRILSYITQTLLSLFPGN